jgi:hypothetical protein
MVVMDGFRLAGFVGMLVLGACTSVTTVARPLPPHELAELNEKLRGDVQLQFKERAAPAVQARDAVLAPQDVSWTDSGGNRQRVPSEALSSIGYVSRTRGAAEGFGIGFLAGAVTGALIGVASGDDSPCGQERFFCLNFSRSEKTIVGGLFLGLTGGLIGAISGALAGHHGSVEFTSTPRQ